MRGAEDRPGGGAPDPIRDIRRVIDAFSRWFDERLGTLESRVGRETFAAWRKELKAVRRLVDEPPTVRVALIGTTGAGKSTFLNAVLRQEVLPVGVMHPCTAFVTAVAFAPGPEYTLTIRYATREEWKRDVDAFIAMLEHGDVDVDGEGHSESSRMLEVARKRLQGVFGKTITEATSAADVRKASLPADAQTILRGAPRKTFTFQDASEMLKHLRGLVRGESPLWPLVREVSIKGPYDVLEGGIELVDLPGLNDPNEARVEVTREFLRSSPFVWLVFPMVRGLTADIERVLQDERVLRTLVLSGTYSGLALVGTKADDIDTDSAEQLGMSVDCEISELVAAYRKQTVREAREQLEGMIREFPAGSEAEDTKQRMLEMAANVRVHTVSASAYNRLAGVGRLRRDYGLHDEQETGIPEVREHLREINRVIGAHFNVQSARLRAQQLGQEIKLYFRAKGEASYGKSGEARTRFRDQSEAFARDVAGYREQAVAELQLRRRGFFERLDPLFAKSVQGVVRVTEAWHGIHWATLRAIVQRDGEFRSPSSGKSYDLNMDMSDPLLAELPVSWERYFSDDLGSVTRELVVRVQEGGKHFCDKVALTAELLSGRPGNPMEDQLGWFRQKVRLLADDAERNIALVIQEGRAELAAKVPTLAKERMQPAYDAVKGEHGTGMKSRILSQLDGRVHTQARPLYEAMQAVIIEGLGDLESQINGLYHRLTETALEQARIVVGNASVELDDVPIDVAVVDVLREMPGFNGDSS